MKAMKRMKVRFEILIKDPGTGELEAESTQSGWTVPDARVNFGDIAVTEVLVGGRRVAIEPPDNVLPFRIKAKG